jgi:hypothetical protein
MDRKIIPNISVDCLVFGFDFERLYVVLKKRELISEETGEVVISDYTLPGHHIRENENADEAANRIIYDITGFDNIYLEQFHCFSSTDRLSKEKDQIWIKHLNLEISNHVFTVGYFSLVDKNRLVLDEEHKNAHWFPIDELPELAFDHLKIFEKGLECLRKKFKLEPIAFELLPERFTLTQLQRLYEAIAGTKYDRRNFRKKISQLKYIIALNEKQNGVPHKPAQVYLFSRDVYDKTKKEKMMFA